MSDSLDSFDNICQKKRELINNDIINTIIMDSYNNGGMFGVQYEVSVY